MQLDLQRTLPQNELKSDKTGTKVGGRRATAFFNPFCNNVLKQVACFCCSFYSPLHKVTREIEGHACESGTN